MNRFYPGILYYFFFCISQNLFSQSCPNNGDFELGTTAGWTCKSGGYGTGTAPNFTATYNAFTCITTGTNGGYTGTNRHVITTAAGGNAPNSTNPLVPVVAPGALFPSGVNNFSFRIGNDATGAVNINGVNCSQAEAISFPIMVNPNNAGFTYMYACFVEDPGHPPESQPRFEIVVKDPQGNVIPCGYYKVVAGDNIAKTFYAGSGGYQYTNWTKVGMDLTAYMGQTLTIEFRTSDCLPPGGGSSITCINNVCTTCSGSCCTTCTNGANCTTTGCTGGQTYAPGSHSAYAFIDAYCIPLQIQAPAICANTSTVQICAPPGYLSYTWPSGQPGLSGNLNAQCVTISSPVAGTVYTVNMTLVTGCPTFTTVTLKGFDITLRDTVVCPTTTPSFSVCATPTVPGNYTYSWSPSTGLSCANCACPVITTPASPVTYTVTATDPSVPGCSVTRTITINPFCGPTVLATGGSICENECLTISATGFAGTPGYSFTWQPGGLNAPSINVCPTSTSTYTVTMYDAAGQTASAIATVTVNPIPNVTASNPVALCLGDSTTLTAGGANLYLWMPGNSSQNPIVVSPQVTTSYTVTGITTAGCTNSAETNVTVNPIPVVTATGGAICQGQSVTINTGGAVNYTWSPSSGLSNPNVSGPSASPVNTTTYTVTGSDANGCSNSASSVVVVESIPTITVTPESICAGGTATLTASGALNYTWLPSNTTGPSITDSPVTSSTYTVTGATLAGCSNSTTASITVYPMPIVYFEPDTAGCSPLTVVFTNSSTGVINSTCFWDFGNGKTSNLCMPLPQVYSVAGVYSVTLTVTSNNCTSSLVRPNIITVYPLPVAGFDADPWVTEVMEPTIRFTNTSVGDSSRTWTFGDGGTSTIDDPVHVYEDTGHYNVCLSVQNAFGCSDSICHTVIIKPVWNFYIPNAFTPNGDGKNETFNGKGENIHDYELYIFDRWGNLIFESTSLQKDWDGKANGGADIAQQDVYVYLVKFKDIFNKQHKLTGSVTL